jgi:hypothetical protein
MEKEEIYYRVNVPITSQVSLPVNKYLAGEFPSKLGEC